MPDRKEYIKILEQISEKVEQNPDIPVFVTPSFTREVLNIIKDLYDERTLCAEYYEGYYKKEPQIVRCKDCRRHYNELKCPCGGYRPDDWFCADGERKSD